MTFLSTGIASSDRGYPGSVDRLLEYHQNTGCGINGPVRANSHLIVLGLKVFGHTSSRIR